MKEIYTPPLQEQLFLMDKLLHWDRVFNLPEFAHADVETATAILTEGARFVTAIISPINLPGDEQGSRMMDNRVITPDGFRDAFLKLSEGGWTGLDLPEEYGGQNLPLIVQTAFSEMISGACMSFGMLPIMLRAATWLLIEHGDQDMKKKVVPNLVTGKWGATVCISEPQAGSDAGRIRCRASPEDDGSYRLSGTKIFISYGDHDLTDQIVHLVLARTPGATPGTGGLSLFLVPGFLFDGHDIMNGVSVGRLEKKMGLKASPTCVLNFDNATAYRIGPEFKGLKCMFTMVNLMRLEVAIQGVAIAGAATQQVLRYAAERKQGGQPDQQPVSIIEHADVRRMLFTMRARTDAMRAMVYDTALNLDMARAGQDEETRTHARYLAEFLLPVCKTCAAEAGFEVASLAIQVMGGHGYISESGVEQYVRDSRVLSIYEGTSGIQALDLVKRKLLKDDGARYQIFRDRVLHDIHFLKGNYEKICKAISQALDCLDRCTGFIQESHHNSMRDIEAIVTDYLHLVGLVAGGWMWLRMMAYADPDSPGNEIRSACGTYYIEYLLPEATQLEQKIMKGARLIDSIESTNLAEYQ